MSKQITPVELAEIVTKLLTNPEAAGELCESQTYLSFVTSIAQVVCDHCGGEIRHDADFLDEACYVGIFGNESLPEGGGIWADYDKEGELFSAEQTPAVTVAVDMLSVAAQQLIPADTELWDCFWVSTEVSRSGAIVGINEALDRVVSLSLNNLQQRTKLEMCSLSFRDRVQQLFWDNTQVQRSGAITGLAEVLRRIAAMEVASHLTLSSEQVSADTILWRVGVQGIEERVDDLVHLLLDGAGAVTVIHHPGAPKEDRRAAFLREFLSV